MQSFLIVLFYFLVLLLLVPSTVYGQENSKFSSERHSLSFTYPSEWETNEIEYYCQDESNLKHILTLNKQNLSQIVSFFISEEENRTLNDYALQIINDNKEHTIKDLSYDLKIGNSSAFNLAFEINNHSNNASDYRVKEEVGTIVNSDFYRITYLSQDSINNDFDRILESLAIEENKSKSENDDLRLTLYNKYNAYLPFVLTGNNNSILSISSDTIQPNINIEIQSPNDGHLFLNVPRNLLDSKFQNGTDYSFEILSNGIPISYIEKQFNDERTLSIPVYDDTQLIEIRGNTKFIDNLSTGCNDLENINSNNEKFVGLSSITNTTTKDTNNTIQFGSYTVNEMLNRTIYENNTSGKNPSTEILKTDSFLTHDDPVNFISIKYPKDWNVDDTSFTNEEDFSFKNRTGIAKFVPISGNASDAELSIFVDTTVRETPMSFETYVEGYPSLLSDIISKSATLSGRTAYIANYSQPDEGIKEIEFGTLADDIKYGDTIYAIRFSAGERDYDRLFPIVKKMIDSFRIEPDQTISIPASYELFSSEVSLIALAGSATQGNPDYDPDPLTIKLGESVTVQNEDTVPHTVTSGEEQGGESGQLFDTSIIDPAGSATIDTTSLEVGEYPFHCMIHPYMKGVLRVN